MVGTRSRTSVLVCGKEERRRNAMRHLRGLPRFGTMDSWLATRPDGTVRRDAPVRRRRPLIELMAVALIREERAA